MREASRGSGKPPAPTQHAGRRAAFFVFAFIALAGLLLQPACEVLARPVAVGNGANAITASQVDDSPGLHAARGNANWGGDEGPCCSSIGRSAPLTPSDAAAGAAEQKLLPSRPAAPWFAARLRTDEPRLATGSAPFQSSFHARSTPLRR